MTVYSPNFNTSDYELRGELPTFLSPQQKEAVTSLTNEVTGQLDWVAQLLGWNGKQYWSSLVSTVSQRRQLLTGSFGVYNKYLYPEVVEVRNWENSVVIKPNLELNPEDYLYVGEKSYTIESVGNDSNGNIKVTLSIPDEDFYEGISQGSQIKVSARRFLPPPFSRPDVMASADYSFHCKVEGERITLFPSFDQVESLPLKRVYLYKGGEYKFDKPVALQVNPNYTIPSRFDSGSELWVLEIPLGGVSMGSTAVLSIENSTLQVGIKDWEDPSDWLSTNVLDNFKGVWSEKGGYKPLHFVFDALSLHGYNSNSIILGEVVRSLKFDDLLNHVYYQRAEVDTISPPRERLDQVWWNAETGSFSIYNRDPLRCGPWVEVDYPQDPATSYPPDFIFPDVTSFQDYEGGFQDRSVVNVLNCAGFGANSAIYNLFGTLLAEGEVLMTYKASQNGWFPIVFTYPDTSAFQEDANALPVGVQVRIRNSDGLSSTEEVPIENLSISIEGEYETSLMKYERDGKWYLSPPSHLKYIGNTRLFSSSQDYQNPVEGEMFWDFEEANPSNRSASIYVYNNWGVDPQTGEPVLSGNWVEINDRGQSTLPPQEVNFGSVLVYCNDTLLQPEEPYISESYEFTYSVDALTGTFNFHYIPYEIDGVPALPRVRISDSITTSYSFDVTSAVFSGLVYYMSPDVSGSEELLRVLKYDPLYSVDSSSEVNSIRFPNSLIAGENLGPGDDNWERYFIRLPIDYQREGAEWQKVNLICQGFGYWGSNANAEKMTCPAQLVQPEIYEELHLYRRAPESSYIYQEPFLYSTCLGTFSSGEDYDNSSVVPQVETQDQFFSPAKIVKYEPLHDRRADVTSPVGKGFGEWQGTYFRAVECSSVSGFLERDIESGNLDPVQPPIWDASIYKNPPTCAFDNESGEVGANHYKIGYAYFVAGFSAAGEAVFDPG